MNLDRFAQDTPFAFGEVEMCECPECEQEVYAEDIVHAGKRGLVCMDCKYEEVENCVY